MSDALLVRERLRALGRSHDVGSSSAASASHSA
jgi:hypothetical protein